jgi:hypothetical protein
MKSGFGLSERVCLGLIASLLASAAFGAPAITSLSPNSIAAGYPFPTLTLAVNGSGFASGATVQWNGTALGTSFVSSAFRIYSPSNWYEISVRSSQAGPLATAGTLPSLEFSHHHFAYAIVAPKPST